MIAISTYKKCLCCGKHYQAADEREQCSCGGHLYMMAQYYQQKVRKADIAHDK